VCVQFDEGKCQKAENMKTNAIIFPLLLASLLVGQQQPPPPPSQGLPPEQTAPSAQQLSPQQLEDLAAPIALYPDTLLSQLLVASTYPLEVVEAQQWLQQNGNLKGKKLMNAAQKQNWDPSIQALVAFPDVLARLNQDIRWTTDLGNAFLAQQADVMAAVQRLRARAQANGKLAPNPQENVTTETQNGQSAIQIEPADPGTVYVPVYNPDYVWGPPGYGYYPPLFYPPIDAGFSFLPGIDLGFYFGGGWGLWGGLGWGWGPNWFGGGIFLNDGFFHRYGFRDFHPGFGGSNVWAHDPGHRLGVPYPNRNLANRFRAAGGMRGGSAFRGGAEGFRGGAEQAPPRGQAGQRFGTPGFERQNPGGNRSAFGGIRSGPDTRMRSDHGFSSMGHAGFGGFGGGSRGGGGGARGGGRR
jgi:uncharacterized membrane protein YgcG